MSVPRTDVSRHESDGAQPLTVTVASAKKLSGLGNTTIWALIKNGALETICIGRRRLIVYRSLEKLLSPEPTEGGSQRPRRGRPPKRPRPDEAVRP
jgi:hypothetical protein